MALRYNPSSPLRGCNENSLAHKARPRPNGSEDCSYATDIQAKASRKGASEVRGQLYYTGKSLALQLIIHRLVFGFIKDNPPPMAAVFSIYDDPVVAHLRDLLIMFA